MSVQSRYYLAEHLAHDLIRGGSLPVSDLFRFSGFAGLVTGTFAMIKSPNEYPGAMEHWKNRDK